MADKPLYVTTQLEEKIRLDPKHLDANIERHLLDALKTKVEGKVGKYGIVIKVNKLISHNQGMVSTTDFTGSAIYTVTYSCLMCSVSKDADIICKVINLAKAVIVCTNGPIVVAIFSYDVNNDNFKVENDNIIIKEEKREIKVDDYLKVSISATNITRTIGESQLLAAAKLLSMASKKEIETFKKEQKMITNTDSDLKEAKQETDDDIFI